VSKFKRAARKATATFLFASLGTVLGNAFFDIDVETWKQAASVGIGSLLNLVYRWAEKAQAEGEG